MLTMYKKVSQESYKGELIYCVACESNGKV